MTFQTHDGHSSPSQLATGITSADHLDEGRTHGRRCSNRTESISRHSEDTLSASNQPTFAPQTNDGANSVSCDSRYLASGRQEMRQEPQGTVKACGLGENDEKSSDSNPDDPKFSEEEALETLQAGWETDRRNPHNWPRWKKWMSEF